MYLAPLNYDRFFKKVFSDSDIARKFLEDFLDTKIESLEILKDKHRVTDDAAFVEFDFRCKIEGAYIIIDMQQWYKAGLAQRFYLYHALNTSLQLETLPKKKILLDTDTKQVKTVKDYKSLEPVYTIIWMVSDTFKFKNENFVSFMMTPEAVVNFVRNEKLWNQKEIKTLMRERAELINTLSNETRDIDFFAKNRLIFIFQKNIVKNIESNQNKEKYARWFEFAEKTRNDKNKAEDFETFAGDPVFDEMMRRLNSSVLTKDELEYLNIERESWEEVKRHDNEHYEEGIKEGRKEGKIEILKAILEDRSLPEDFIGRVREELALLKGNDTIMRNK